MRIHVALISGVEPAVTQHRRRLLPASASSPAKTFGPRTRISWFSPSFHLNAGNCRFADASGSMCARIVHRCRMAVVSVRPYT